MASLTGRLVAPDGQIPADMTGLSMAIYNTSQDLIDNSNIAETITGISTTNGIFTVNSIIITAGTYHMRLYDPLDYTSYAYGQIEAV